MVIRVANAQVEYNKELVPANRSAGISLEKNILFHAQTRLTVTQQGNAPLNLNMIFDGKMAPSYTGNAPSLSDPTVVTIEGLPVYHTQQGVWVGWSTRWWRPTNFKIEAFHSGSSTWTVVAHETNHLKYSFMKKMPSGTFTKLRFSFYETNGTNGRLGISELFFLMPEYAQAYDHLMVQYNKDGNVGVGTTNPSHKLTVAGTAKAQEVIVEENAGADFVFEEDYDLPTLANIEAFIKANKHLEGIPSAEEMKANGVKVGELQIKLLQKIEELTLYVIDLKKENGLLKEEKIVNNVQQDILNKQQAMLEAQAELIKAMQEELEAMKKRIE